MVNSSRINSADIIDIFEGLIKKLDRRVYNIAYHLTGNPLDAKDLVQETLVKAFPAFNFKRYQSTFSFENWLYRIMVNTYIDKIRKRRRVRWESLEKKSEFEKGHPQINIPDFTQNPESLLEKKELNICMQTAIKSLPPPQQIAIILVDVEELPYQLVSKILKCSLGTVKSRVFRGREKLREMLKPYLENGEVILKPLLSALTPLKLP